jgi:hypothetical protein
MVSGENVITDINSENYARHVLKKRNIRCTDCGALMWIEEKLVASSKKKPRFGVCCLQGSIKLPADIPLPSPILNLLTDQTPKSVNFRNSIRLYNTILSFTSMSANEDKTLAHNTLGNKKKQFNIMKIKNLKFKIKGVYNFRIQGAVHHKISNFHSEDVKKAGFSQIYIYDSEMQSNIRNTMFPNTIDSSILNIIQNILIEKNPYVRIQFS